MRILVVEPEKTPYEKEISGDISSMQKIVGGWTEVVYPYQEKVCLVCNDESSINGMPCNRLIEEIDFVICGNFFLCGIENGDFSSLDTKQIEYFKKKYDKKEIFLKSEQGIGVLRIDMEKPDKKPKKGRSL